MGRSKILPEAQRKFIAEYVSNGQSGVKAYLSAYPGVDIDSARSSSSRLLASDTIRARVLRAIEAHNLGPEVWAETIADAIHADTEKSIPDYNVRLKAVDLCAKLSDAYPRETGVTHDHRHAHLHVQVTEPIEVTRFRVLHGRAPSDRELQALIGDNSNAINVLPAKK